MSIVIIAVVLVAILSVGVGLMLHSDRREQRRIEHNGGRRI